MILHNRLSLNGGFPGAQNHRSPWHRNAGDLATDNLPPSLLLASLFAYDEMKLAQMGAADGAESQLRLWQEELVTVCRECQT